MKRKKLFPVLLLLLSSSILSAGPLISSRDRVIFIGASITAFGNYKEGYISLVKECLAHQNIKPVIFPRGISAQTSREMAKRAEKELADSKANFLILVTGINDVGLNRSYEEFTRNLIFMLDAADKYKCRVLLLTLTPHGEDLNNERNTRIRKFNDFVRKQAKERNYLLAEVYGEMEKLLADRKHIPGYKATTDNLHLNGYGNRAWACAVLRALQIPEEEIRKAVERWNKLPTITPVINNFFRPAWLISINDYEVLQQAALKEKLSMDAYIRKVIDSKVKELRSGGK